MLLRPPADATPVPEASFGASPGAPPDLDLGSWRDRALRFEAAVAGAVLGQEPVVRLLTIATFARGHVLLEGDVGVGKTTLLRAVARALGGRYARVEGTVDLMPADLVYNAHLGEDGRPRIDPGPLLEHGAELAVFFFNEINRARPQVHALLLRAMAERSVTAFGREHRLPHLQVFADRNRIEREETFELPAAARDRFLMEVAVTMPADAAARLRLAFDPRFHDTDALIGAVAPAVLDPSRMGAVAAAIQGAVRTSPVIEAYVGALWDAVREPHRHGIAVPGAEASRLVLGGASPRGVAFLVRAARVRAWLEGRAMVVPEDLRAVFVPVMAHRVFLDPVYELRRETLVPALCAAVFDAVPAP